MQTLTEAEKTAILAKGATRFRGTTVSSSVFRGDSTERIWGTVVTYERSEYGTTIITTYDFKDEQGGYWIESGVVYLTPWAWEAVVKEAGQ